MKYYFTACSISTLSELGRLPKEFDLDAEDFSNMDKCFHKIKVPFKKEFKKAVHNNYIKKTFKINR
jgi:hypothetical protein